MSADDILPLPTLRRRGHTVQVPNYGPTGPSHFAKLCLCPLADDHRHDLLIGLGGRPGEHRLVSPLPIIEEAQDDDE